jgi:ABC-2 type transport system ATP-binding protein
MNEMKTPEANGYAVETRQLVKRFGRFTAVDRLDLRIPRGLVYGLLGPNGSGKTTTIRMMCGLAKPTAGEVEVLGRLMPDHSVNASLGYMPQETAIYPGITVHQNLRFFGRIYGMSKSEIEEREDELLAFINLEKWRDELVANLSGGMKHRVSLACAMLHRPSLLVLDEPTVGVDPELRATFWDYFGTLRDGGATILITTHYMDEASHCDRIGFLREGRLMAEGSPKEILEQAGVASLEDAFLEFARRSRGSERPEGGGEDEAV